MNEFDMSKCSVILSQRITLYTFANNGSIHAYTMYTILHIIGPWLALKDEYLNMQP